ncbi:MAG: M20/M25/M40 family metallo-hydrolase [Chloroflexota bacterium]|nr:M20/M25/M40 family metallo-hydrolase [Chloroflexota bacterium]
MNDLFAFVDEHADRYVEMLRQLLRQPSVSAQGVGMAETPGMVEELLSGIGADARRIDTRGGYPVVYGELRGSSPKTLRYYNHYDVQPAEPLDLWQSDPWAAEIRDGRIWARGVADNKGNLVSRIAALDAFRRVRGQPPLTVRFIVEGEEEIGSPNLVHFADDHPDLCQADGCIWESGSSDLEGRPLVNLGMKGICYVELRATGARSDQHSSVATATPNPAWRLVWALASLKGPDERVLIPGFYDRVLPPTPEERTMLERMPNLERQRLEHLGIDRFLLDLTGVDLLERDYFQPTCTISGILSGYTGEGSKTVLPSRAMAKVDMRLVPDQDPHEIFDLLRRHLDRNGFDDIEMTLLGPERPGRTPPSAPIAQTVVDAWRELAGIEPVVVPTSAGTGPWYELCTRFGVDGCTAGIGHARSNAHAPNENVFVEDFVRGIKLQCLILERFAAA